MPAETSKPDLAKELEQLAEGASTVEQLMTTIVGRLAERLEKYNWVGFYMLEKGAPEKDIKEPTLVLGPHPHPA
jgi:putative methionine-R-sulfoxide reductase with GAF domain